MPSFDEPTLGEVYRLMNQHYVEFERKSASLEASLQANSDVTLRTLEQATKTNGRVNKIEDDFYGKDGYPGTRKEVHELRESYLFRKGAQWVILGMITFIPGTLMAFAALWIKDQVRDSMDNMNTRLEERIDRMEQTLSQYEVVK